MPKAVFGLIGTGGIARSQHLPNLTRATHARLKTICDLDESRLDNARQRYDIPHATTDHKELLADPEIQAVVVATKDDAQAPLTIEALAAGKHVYVEKPLATDAETCRKVVEAQRRAGLFVAVGFNRRFAPAYRKVKEILTAHGDARNIYYRVSDEYWRWGAKMPPGVRVIHEICHMFDAIRWLAGSDVESVYCVNSRPDDEVIVLKLTSGCVATIMDSGYATRDMPKERLEIIAEKGGLTVEDFVEMRTFGMRDFEPIYRFAGHTHPEIEFAHKYILEKLGTEGLLALRRQAWEALDRVEHLRDDEEFPERDELVAFTGRGPDVNYMMDKGWLHAVEHFAQCVLSGDAPQTATAEDAWKASALSNAAIKSRESGEIVKI
mgnify:CR=1 FL=1